MRKNLLLVVGLVAFTVSTAAQLPFFKTGNNEFKATHLGSTSVTDYKDYRTFLKYPNVILFKEQLQGLVVAPENILYQGVLNTFNKTYTVMERNRKTLEFSVFNYDITTGVKTILFNEINSPIPGKAIKPIGFVSQNLLIVEAVVFDSHLDHEGIFALNLNDLSLMPIGIDAKYMSTPILNIEITGMYYISTTDAIRETIHGNYNVLKYYSFLDNVNRTLHTATGVDAIDFIGWEATTLNLQKQTQTLSYAQSQKSLVQYLLPFDNNIGYFTSRHGTPAPVGAHVPSGYDPVYLGFNSHGYPAVDFDTPDDQNDNIRASAPGTVTFAGISCGLTCGYGRLVIIEHADGQRTYNGHMVQIIASVDDCVGYGAIIGLEGTTGGSSGDHQHFEWRAAGGNTSTIGTFEDVGQPRAGYRYVSHTPVLACNVSSPVLVPSDAIDPTTIITAPSTFVNTNFSATFADSDNSGGSGVEKAFYQAIDYNNGDWRGNGTRGFFSDNFDQTTIHPDWATQTGTWAINAGALQQTNQTLSNTHISAYVKSTMSNRYLYEFEGKIEGTGTNRRAGLHYFSSSATLPNRGNGYFAWFKVDADQIEIYKVTSDVFTLISNVSFDFNAATWYNFKVAYDRTNGKTQVWVNNDLALTHTDASPYLTGDYVSFRSGECLFSVNQIKVYRTRLAASTILVSPTGDFRYDNPNPATPAGRVKSIITDVIGNISTIDSEDVNVDMSVPSNVATVNDGNALDIDVSSVSNSFAANWTNSTDVNSNVVKYFYSMGTSAGAVDILPWTNNVLATTVNVTGLNLIPGTTYFINIKSENGSGLQSAVTSSDGVLISASGAAPVAAFTPLSNDFCTSDSVRYNNASQNASAFQWSFPGGSPATSTAVNPKVFYPTSGSYTSTLISTNGSVSDTVVQTEFFNVYNSPNPIFTASETTVNLLTGSVTFTNTSTNATSYFWDFGDNGGSSTDFSPFYTYNAPGVYTVVLTATNVTCGSQTAQVVITVTENAGINQTNVSNFEAYYDQNSNSLIISAFKPINEKVSLMNNEGRLVFENQFNALANTKTNLLLKTNPSAGIYFLRIGNESFKIAISKN